MLFELGNIVGVPEGCFPTAWSSGLVSFPALVPVLQDCRVYATLIVNVFAWSKEKSWLIDITKYVPSAAENEAVYWMQSGRGSKYKMVDITFRPGAYLVSVDQPPKGDWGVINFEQIIDRPKHCFGKSTFTLTSQIRIQSDCRVFAILNAKLDIARQNTPWEVSITKLD